jgi:hypothetical protein
LRTDRRRAAPRTAVISIAALAWAAGCVDRVPTQPRADALIVQAVLDAGASDQYVVVQRTNGAVDQQIAVAGATVTLSLPNGRVLTAAEEVDSARLEPRFGEPPLGVVYHFALGAEGISLVPGGTYALRVEAPDGRVVTGTTTIPNATPVPDGNRVAESFSFRDTLTLAWHPVPGARSYELRVDADERGLTMFIDTSIVISAFSNSKLTPGVLFTSGATNELVVSAVDANYYDYYRHAPDPFTGNGVISHLAGGIGLFGSIVELDRRTLAVQ